LKKVLAIAGSDCSGGAGIQADIKTITAHKQYAMSVITALTAQNTTEVFGISDVLPEFVGKQLDCVFTDIFPDAVKIGMVSNAETACVVADKLKQHKAVNIVLDPVMVAASGGKLLKDDAVWTVKKRLIPLASVVTPNIPEAELLCGMEIKDDAGMLRAAGMLSEMTGGAVLIKGGHLINSADDLLYMNGEAVWLRVARVDNPNTHGTGCTLSSAIACGLARGLGVTESVSAAKDYITGALEAGLDLGNGCGPLNHFYAL